MTKKIESYEDIIDSRDVIARIEELEFERDAAEDPAAWDAENSEEAEELAALKDLAAQGESCGDWIHGATLIRDSYFETYAQELAEDCGMLENATSWPATCIDWQQAARELQQDYTDVTFDGVTYWVRS